MEQPQDTTALLAKLKALEEKNRQLEAELIAEKKKAAISADRASMQAHWRKNPSSAAFAAPEFYDYVNGK